MVGIGLIVIELPREDSCVLPGKLYHVALLHLPTDDLGVHLDEILQGRRIEEDDIQPLVVDDLTHVEKEAVQPLTPQLTERG